MKSWMKGFKGYRLERGRKRQPGSRAVLSFEDGGGQLEVVEEVAGVVPGRRLELVLKNKNMISEQVYEFLDQGEGRCRVRLISRVQLRPWLFNLFSPFVKGPMQRQQDEDLERLRRQLSAKG